MSTSTTAKTVGKAVIYCRISSDRESTENGVDRQEEDCRALASRMGLDVVAVYRDNDVSASTQSRKARPEYDAMMADAREGRFNVILAYSNSRLTRRVREYLDLIDLHERYGVRIHTAVSGDHDLSTADGRGAALTVAVWDAAEAERVAERVRRAKQQAVTEGRYRGGRRPFGYEADGVTIREDEAELIRRATRDVLSGRSMRAVAAEWPGIGAGEAERNQASARVRRILMRARNAGLIEANGEIIGQAAWPAIITPDEHRALVATLTNPARRTNAGATRRHLLSGIATCAICNDGTTVHMSSNRGRPSYTCSRTKHVIRASETIDAAVVGVVHKLIRDPRVIDALRPVERAEESQADRDRAEALRDRLRAAEADYQEGLLNGRQLHETTQRVEAELVGIAQREASRMSGTVLSDLAGAPDPAAAFDAAPLDKRQAVIDALLHVSIGQGGKGRPKGWAPGEPYADLRNVVITRRALPRA